MPNNPPRPVVIIIGSPEPLRRSKPTYPAPPRSKRPPGWSRQGIPDPRRHREMLDEARRALRDARPQIEAMKAAGRALLAA
jgi:hypothetical protein